MSQRWNELGNSLENTTYTYPGFTLFQQTSQTVTAKASSQWSNSVRLFLCSHLKLLRASLSFEVLPIRYQIERQFDPFGHTLDHSMRMDWDLEKFLTSKVCKLAGSGRLTPAKDKQPAALHIGVQDSQMQRFHSLNPAFHKIHCLQRYEFNLPILYFSLLKLRRWKEVKQWHCWQWSNWRIYLKKGISSKFQTSMLCNTKAKTSLSWASYTNKGDWNTPWGGIQKKNSYFKNVKKF